MKIERLKNGTITLKSETSLYFEGREYSKKESDISLEAFKLVMQLAFKSDIKKEDIKKIKV